MLGALAGGSNADDMVTFLAAKHAPNPARRGFADGLPFLAARQRLLPADLAGVSGSGPRPAPLARGRDIERHLADLVAFYEAIKQDD